MKRLVMQCARANEPDPTLAAERFLVELFFDDAGLAQGRVSTRPTDDRAIQWSPPALYFNVTEYAEVTP